MACVTLLGSKGGVGTSLIATNLAAALAQRADTLLVDLHGADAADDLLLDLMCERGWQDLLPVAEEFSRDHLERVARWHDSGIGLVGSTGQTHFHNDKGLLALLLGLKSQATWIVLDVNSRDGVLLKISSKISDLIVIVTTLDPLALRAAVRLRSSLTDRLEQLGLVLNQVDMHHPASAGSIANSLDLPLAACVRRDPLGAAVQVNLGELPTLDHPDGLATAAQQLAGWVTRRAPSPRLSGSAEIR